MIALKRAREDGPHTPGFTKECSEMLARDRDVLGVGVETVGTDAGRAATFDPPFPNHYVMHGSGKSHRHDLRFVSGHGFSRAEDTSKTRGFSH